MSLREWAEAGWIRPHMTSPQEVGDLLNIVDRDLHDAEGDISADWRFGIAYNAALKLCTVLLYASGYRPEHHAAHFRTLASLPLILGIRHSDDEVYLQACRTKRNAVEYDRTGGVTEADVEELAEFAADLRVEVMQWLRENRPELLEP